MSAEVITDGQHCNGTCALLAPSLPSNPAPYGTSIDDESSGDSSVPVHEATPTNTMDTRRYIADDCLLPEVKRLPLLSINNNLRDTVSRDTPPPLPKIPAPELFGDTAEKPALPPTMDTFTICLDNAQPRPPTSVNTPTDTPTVSFQTTPPVSPVLSYVVPECSADTEDEGEHVGEFNPRGVTWPTPSRPSEVTLPSKVTARSPLVTPPSSVQLSETSRCRLSSTSSSSDSYYDKKLLSPDKDQAKPRHRHRNSHPICHAYFGHAQSLFCHLVVICGIVVLLFLREISYKTLVTAALVICAYVMLLSEAKRCGVRRQLLRLDSRGTCYSYIERVKRAPPSVRWSASSRNVGVVRNLRDSFRDRKAFVRRQQSKEERHSECYRYDEWTDKTLGIEGIYVSPVVILESSKVLIFKDEHTRKCYNKEYTEFRSNAHISNTQDGVEKIEYLHIDGFKRKQTLRRDSNQSSDWWLADSVFWACTVLMATWPYRLWFMYKTSRLFVVFVKEIGTRSDPVCSSRMSNSSSASSSSDTPTRNHVITGAPHQSPSYRRLGSDSPPPSGDGVNGDGGVDTRVNGGRWCGAGGGGGGSPKPDGPRGHLPQCSSGPTGSTRGYWRWWSGDDGRASGGVQPSGTSRT